MTGAGVFWFLFSIGGIVTLLLAGALWLWARPASKGPRVFVLAVAVGYTLASLYPVPYNVGRALGSGFHVLKSDEVPDGRNVVVLLGSGSHSRRDWTGSIIWVLDPIGAERTLEASRVYHLVRPDWVISCGGLYNPDDWSSPSGQTMKDALVALDVPADRILVERTSRSTREQAVLVAAMLPPLHVDHVILVTSEIHMRRSIGVFRSVGLDAIPAIAREWSSTDWSLQVVPTQTGLYRSALVAHELGGLVYYWLRGWYR